MVIPEKSLEAGQNSGVGLGPLDACKWREKVLRDREVGSAARYLPRYRTTWGSAGMPSLVDLPKRAKTTRARQRTTYLQSYIVHSMYSYIVGKQGPIILTGPEWSGFRFISTFTFQPQGYCQLFGFLESNSAANGGIRVSRPLRFVGRPGSWWGNDAATRASWRHFRGPQPRLPHFPISIAPVQ